MGYHCLFTVEVSLFVTGYELAELFDGPYGCHLSLLSSVFCPEIVQALVKTASSNVALIAPTEMNDERRLIPAIALSVKAHCNNLYSITSRYLLMAGIFTALTFHASRLFDIIQER